MIRGTTRPRTHASAPHMMALSGADELFGSKGAIREDAGEERGDQAA